MSQFTARSRKRASTEVSCVSAKRRSTTASARRAALALVWGHSAPTTLACRWAPRAPREDKPGTTAWERGQRCPMRHSPFESTPEMAICLARRPERAAPGGRRGSARGPMRCSRPSGPRQDQALLNHPRWAKTHTRLPIPPTFVQLRTGDDRSLLVNTNMLISSHIRSLGTSAHG